MVGITLIPKDSGLSAYGNPAPYRVAASYRELLSIFIDLVNTQGFPQEHTIMLLRGSNRAEWSRIPDNATEIQVLKDELRTSRSRMAALLDKAWECYGTFVGENEFEGYDHIKWAREQINDIDKILTND